MVHRIAILIEVIKNRFFEANLFKNHQAKTLLKTLSKIQFAAGENPLAKCNVPTCNWEYNYAVRFQVHCFPCVHTVNFRSVSFPIKTSIIDNKIHLGVIIGSNIINWDFSKNRDFNDSA